MPDDAAYQRPSRYRGTLGQKGLIAAAALYLGLLLVLPVGALVVRTASGGLWRALSAVAESTAAQAILASLGLAVLATIVNSAFGVLAALVIVRQRFLGRRVFDALVDLPLAISPVMVGLGLLLVYGSNGVLAPVLDALHLQVAFAPLGVALATLFVTLPFAVRQAGHVLAQAGVTEEQAAATLGASPWQRFWYVTLPQMKYGLIFGATLTAARALGEFGAVLVIGGAIAGRTRTATTFIYAAFEERRETAAFAVALLLSSVSIALLVVLQVVGRRLRARSPS